MSEAHREGEIVWPHTMSRQDLADLFEVPLPDELVVVEKVEVSDTTKTPQPETPYNTSMWYIQHHIGPEEYEATLH